MHEPISLLGYQVCALKEHWSSLLRLLHICTCGSLVQWHCYGVCDVWVIPYEFQIKRLTLWMFWFSVDGFPIFTVLLSCDPIIVNILCIVCPGPAERNTGRLSVNHHLRILPAHLDVCEEPHYMTSIRLQQYPMLQCLYVPDSSSRLLTWLICDFLPTFCISQYKITYSVLNI